MKDYGVIAVKNLKKDGLQYRWTTVNIDYDGEVYEADYMTNKEGCGIFEVDNYYNQHEGTCDFCLKQNTISGARKALKKYYEIGEEED